MSTPLFTVIVASRKGRRAVQRTLASLAEQQAAPLFHVVVVLDGATDDTAEAVEAAGYHFDAVVLEQSQRGMHYARDLGTSAAMGDRLLFLDEEAAADRGLLAALAAAHDEGAAAAQPAVELDGAAPAMVLTRLVRHWMRDRSTRLGEGALRPSDICPAPLSLTRETYAHVRELSGPLGYETPGIGEDFRLGRALNAAGARTRYCPQVACRLLPGTSVARVLEHSWCIGRADLEVITASAETADSVAAARAERWVTSSAAERLVEKAPVKAAHRSRQIEQELLAKARRGISTYETLSRLEEAVALEYALGVAGHPARQDRPG